MERLDRFLAQAGHSTSREKAKREILAGWVRINGETCRDVSRKVEGTEEIQISRPGGEYASRGGYKLERALEVFNIDVRGKIVADLGASTGGFTDCLLKRGAAHVYAVDVGYGQLAYSLRTDERVSVMERTNVRNLVPDSFSEAVDFITGDLSFISITKIYSVLRELFLGKEAVFLVKPQFEARPNEHKKGVIKDRKVHVEVLSRCLGLLAEEGALIHALTYSPITGPKGNREFLLYFTVGNEKTDLPKKELVTCAVDDAWRYAE